MKGRIRLSDADPDSKWIWVQIHLANRMTLGVSNVSLIHFGFKFIINPDPIIEYAQRLHHGYTEITQMTIKWTVS